MEQYVKVACIQIDCIPWNIEHNLKKAEQFIIQANELGVEIVILPELFNIGYNLEEFNYSISQYMLTVNELSRLAKAYKIYILAGIAEIKGRNIYNSAVVFNSEGKKVCNYRKMNLFPLSKEDTIFSRGDRQFTFMIKDIKIGILICYDIRFPNIARAYRKSGCDAIIVIAAFPFPRLEHWQILLKARAIENQVYVLASNRVGKDSDSVFLGSSCIIDPWGTIKALCNETEEVIIVHDIYSDKVKEVRKFLPLRL